MGSLVEWIDPTGLQLVRRLLEDLGRNRTQLTEEESRRIRFLKDYLQAIDDTYGRAVVGPLGRQARPLTCDYAQIRNGRMYCRTHRGPEWSENQHSYVCAQGMPSALRPYLMHKWAHDLDIENCHAVLMQQLGAYYHLWPEHKGRTVAPLHLPILTLLVRDRDALLQEVANIHGLPEDANKYAGYRKDVCKPLFLRILYGGTYDSWMRDNNLFCGVRSKKVDRLQHEMRALRMAIVSAKRFEELVTAERRSQKRHGKSVDAIERGVFSKIAQHLENVVLLSMVTYLRRHRWTVLSLVFDGLIVQHREDTKVDLDAMARFVERDTQFSVNIVEKPLYRYIPHPESLLR